VASRLHADPRGSALNSSAEFDLNEYGAVWKKPKYAPWGFDEYKDFNVSNALII
jgi:hypothetical protein